MTLDQIKQAIEQLSVSEVFALSEWLSNYCEERWDKQIEEDAEAGRLDKVLNEVDEAYKQGLTTPL